MSLHIKLRPSQSSALVPHLLRQYAVQSDLCLHTVMMWCVYLYLLWFLLEVHSQIFPHVSFMGETVPDHGYVNLGLVGTDHDGVPGDTVRCHTDLETCCSMAEGDDRGDWYFIAGETKRLPFSRQDGDIFQARGDQYVDLRRRNNANMQTGLYRCDIHVQGPTNMSCLQIKQFSYQYKSPLGSNSM